MTVLSGAVQSSILSIDNADLESQFKVFPNSANDILYVTSNISNPDYSVSFFDSLIF
ncbi:MAG: hypothetical protein HKP48_02530 [Winogradskyella sp.]|uniref:hypothetical protein n=1 Tax=Winogradskyella sp. TaxID=1883156 RepID=UPI00182045B3|nr:hypothetical protein [Winogradskyella sp.]MBT8244969.1 hypothetical protein [Winogradskyella sp.]NNK22189.1 hypothetical protein [Winogradskyella sp.]